MRRRQIGWVSLLLVLALAVPGGAHSTDAADLLRKAEEVRRKDPKAFAITLSELEKLEGTLSPPQSQHLRYLKAYRLALTGKYTEAIRDSVELHESTRDPALKLRAALLVANSAAVARDFTRGMRYLDLALGIVPQVSDVDLQQQALLVAGVLYNQYGQFLLAEQYAERVLAATRSPRIQCFGRQVRAEALMGRGALKDDVEVESAIAQCQSLDDPITTGFLRTYLARSWAARGNPRRAIGLLEAHLAGVDATGYPRLIGEVHGLLAEYRLSIGDVGAAEMHARHALAKSDGESHTLPLVTAHKVLYEVAVKRGNLADALSQYRSFADADKARLDDIKAREFAFQLSRHELEQKNHAIELLQKQNEVLKLQQEVSKVANHNAQLLLVLLAMVLAAIAYWAYKLKRVQMMFRRQAEMDGLTGISNRRHFRQKGEALLQRCAGSGREATMVLLDLDYFKRINDRHGHAVGDWVLQQVAVALQAASRESDICARLGGEEFAILSCGSDIDTARLIAQRCREHLAAIDTSVIGRPVTASFGCTSSAESGYAFESMFAHADAAMYQAKASGRDRVRVYGVGAARPSLSRR